MDKIRRHDIYNLIVLFIFNLVIKLLYLKKYPIGADSFHFLNNTITKKLSGVLILDLGKVLTAFQLTLIIFVLGLFIVCVFYILARLYLEPLWASLASLFFITSATIFQYTQYNFVDKNVFVLLILIPLYYIVLHKNINEYVRLSIYSLLLILLSYMWEGWIIVPIITLPVLFIRYWINDKKLFYVLISVLSLGLLRSFSGILKLIKYLTMTPDKFFITELLSPLLIPLQPDYIIIIISLVLIFFIKDIKKYKYLVLMYFLTFAGFIIGFRLIIFFLPFVYIIFGLILKQLRPKFYQISIIIFVIAIASGGHYTATGDMSDDMIPVFDYINELPENCVIPVWDKGYMFEYYTQKDVNYKGSAYNFRELLDYYIYGNKTDCIIVFNDDDLKSIEIMSKYEDIDINITDYKIWDYDMIKINEYYIIS